MPTPRKILCRCTCGWEHELDVDLDVEPPFWVYECPAPECRRINNVEMQFDVSERRKPSKWFRPRLAE